MLNAFVKCNSCKLSSCRIYNLTYLNINFTLQGILLPVVLEPDPKPIKVHGNPLIESSGSGIRLMEFYSQCPHEEPITDEEMEVKKFQVTYPA